MQPFQTSAVMLIGKTKMLDELFSSQSPRAFWRAFRSGYLSTCSSALSGMTAGVTRKIE